MLSKFSVKKPYTVVVGVVLILILGFVSFTEMTTDLLPSIDFPYAVVMTTYVGASPEQVEETVTRPVEQSMATINNIKNISSMSQENVSVVILEFDDSVNMDSVSLDIREKLDLVSAYWSDDIGSSTIMKLNPDMLPILVAAVDVEDMSIVDVTDYVEQQVIPVLESTEGVASVSSQGLFEEQVNVVINQKKIDEVNEKIKEALTSKLDEAKDQLDAANEEITTNKSELTQKTEEFYEGIRTGEATIQESKAELLKSEILLEVSETQLNQNEETMKTLKETVTKLEKALAELESMLESEQVEGTVQVVEDLVTQTKDSMIQIDAQLKDLEKTKTSVEKNIETVTSSTTMSEVEKEAALQALNASLEQVNSAIDELTATKASMSSLKEVLEAALKVANDQTLVNAIQSELTSLKKQIRDGENAITAGKKEISAAKNKISEGKKLLKNKEEELHNQKDEVGTQLEDANQQLIKGEEELKEQLEALEEKKQEALANADLNRLITSESICKILMAQNFSMPAGYVMEEGEEYLIRVGDKLEKIRELRNMVVFDLDIEGLEPILLCDVADVFKANNAATMYAKVNGNDAVILSMQKQTNYATADVCKRVQDKFEQLKQEQEGLHTTYLMDQGMYIDLVVQSVLDNLIYGGILAVIILFLFLRDLRPTFIIACSIPISVMFAIVLMYFSGVTLNIISLSGLAVGVGMLVDNSVVVIENIYRLRSKGVSAVKAAVSGAVQVSGAIIASTLTTICVFLPIVFVKGITRQLFVDMALTIGYSLSASLLIALTLVPMMSASMMKNSKEKEHRFFQKIMDGYEKVVRTALNGKVVIIFFTLLLLVASVSESLRQGFAYMPEMDSPQISVSMQMPEGAEFEDTVSMSNQVIELIETLPDVETVGAMMSSGGLFNTASRQDAVNMYVILKEEKTQTSQVIAKQIEELCKELECELTVSGSTMDVGALGGEGISIHVRGKDLDLLKKTAEEVAEIVATVEGTTEVANGIEDPTKELRITVNKGEAMAYGLTVAGAYQQIASAITSSKQATTLVFKDGSEYPVMLFQRVEGEVSIEEIENFVFEVTGQSGEKVPLKIGEVAEVSREEGFSTINRESQQRYLTVSSKVEDGYNVSLVTSAVKEALKEYQVPTGFDLVYEGENETIMESFDQLVKMLLLGILCIYLIMVAQFQSLLSPFIVLFTLPLAFTGGFLGLLATQNVLSVIAMIGFVMLAGIVVNNGIVLVDYMNQLRVEGMEKREAIIEASKTRVRPILMTALTTILGLSTMAVGVGEGADMVQPIAIVTIGGLSYATAMTLFVIPILYDIFHRREIRTVQKEELEVTDR